MTRPSLGQKIYGKLSRLATHNPVTNRYYREKRKEVLRRPFLESPAYERLFLTGYPDPPSFLGFLDDAQDLTPNFRYRHWKIGRILGGWRWKGLFAFRDRIIPIVFSPEKTGIDFGGGAGPISLDTIVVDSGRKDAFDRPIEYHRLTELGSPVDYIFSSHTLEHISDLERVLEEFLDALKPGGDLILNLPAYTCVRWRHGEHSHRSYNDHQWTFHLEHPPEVDLPRSIAVDKLVSRYFDVRVSEYTGDNSIVILAKG